MKRFVLLATGAAMATIPAFAGLTGNPALSHRVPVRVPAGVVPVRVADVSVVKGHGREAEPGHGREAEPGHAREAEPGHARGSAGAEPGDRGAGVESGDDRGAGVEPGDDRGAGVEPGDDRGAPNLRTASSPAGGSRGPSGRGSDDGNGGHDGRGGGGDDGPGHR